MPRGHIFGYNVPSSGVDRIGRDATNVEQKDEGYQIPYSLRIEVDGLSILRVSRIVPFTTSKLKGDEYGVSG
jgi:hypothetical protein